MREVPGSNPGQTHFFSFFATSKSSVFCNSRRVWLVQPRTEFTRIARLVGTAPVLDRPERVLLSPASRPEQTFTMELGLARTSILIPNDHVHTHSGWTRCTEEVTMVTHTYFEECTKFGTLFHNDVLCFWSTVWLA